MVAMTPNGKWVASSGIGVTVCVGCFECIEDMDATIHCSTCRDRIHRDCMSFPENPNLQYCDTCL